jgi:hypothetical protein
MPETLRATAAIDNQFAADNKSRSPPEEYLLCPVVHRIALLEEGGQMISQAKSTMSVAQGFVGIIPQSANLPCVTSNNDRTFQTPSCAYPYARKTPDSVSS